MTPSGIAKIADFGLAKPASDGAAPHTRARTVTSYTEPGVVLGTVGYMAPEQVRGQECDSRADIFSLGCVLFEMLTGHRPFRRETAAETMSAILNSDPERSERDAPLSPALDSIVRHCLEKRPEQRFQSARDLAFALRALAAPGDGPPTAVRVASATTHSILPLPAGTHLAGQAPPALAISRDGSKVAFVAIGEDGASHLYVCHLDRGETDRVPESGFAQGPFFSPDGEWVAFAVDVSAASPRRPELRMHSFSSGLTQAICALADYGGGCWAEDGAIYFIGAVAAGVLRVAPGGMGAETFLGRFRVGGATGPRCLGFPRLIPGDRAALVLDWDASFLGDLSVIDLQTGELSAIAHAGATGAPVGQNHLLHSRTDGTVLAVPFDLTRPRVRTRRRGLERRVPGRSRRRVRGFGDRNPRLRPRSAPRERVRNQADRAGPSDAATRKPCPFPPEVLRGRPSLSPDGRRLAVASRSTGIWIYDLARRRARACRRGRRASCTSRCGAPTGVASSFEPRGSA